MADGKIPYWRTIRGAILWRIGLLVTLVFFGVTGLYLHDRYTTLREGIAQIVLNGARLAAQPIDAANDEAIDLARTSALLQANGLFGLRARSLTHLRGSLEASPELLATFLIYERDADGKDGASQQQAGTDAGGRFTPLWRRTGAGVRLASAASKDPEVERCRVSAPGKSTEASRHCFGEPRRDAEGRLVADILHPVYGQGGQLLGAAGVTRRLDRLGAALKQALPSPGAELLLVSRRGQVIASTRDASLAGKPLARVAGGSAFGAMATGKVKTVEGRDGHGYIVAVAPISRGGWRLYLRVPEAGLLRPVISAVLRSGLITLAGVLVLFWVLLRTARNITAPIEAAAASAQAIARGDLTAEVTVSARNETGQLLEAIRTMSGNLGDLVRQTQELTAQVNSSTVQILASATELEGNTETQAGLARAVEGTAEEIAGTAKELSGTMNEIARTAERTRTAATSSVSDLEGMVRGIERMKGITERFVSQMRELGQRARTTDSIIVTFTKIADQINLLSLNAALEAEKAGEAGRGFAVVSREIRRLADQSANAILEIEAVLGGFSTSFAEGVEQLEQLAAEVRSSAKEIETVGTRQSTIIDQVRQLSPRVDAINEGMGQQLERTSRISAAIGELSDGAERVDRSLKDFRSSTASLNDVAQRLAGRISQFKV